MFWRRPVSRCWKRSGSAEAALEIVNAQTIYLLLTDSQMPGRLSGVDLANIVAQRFSDAAIVVATGRLTLNEVDLPPGAEFFTKPYDFATVVTRLQALSKDRRSTV
jgi:DNA-binding response OmpR family regulator